MSLGCKAVIYPFHILNRVEMRLVAPSLDNDNFLVKLLLSDILSQLIPHILIPEPI